MPDIGDEFGGFRIDGVLGRGGMGTVYRATDLTLKRPVAIKVLSRQLSSDAQFVERFRREAEIQANLEHQHIVAVHAFGEIGDDLYLVMRMIRGDALSTLLDQGRLSRSEALDLLAQVADALDSAHQVNLVHRDVKPDNILVSEDGNAYLADFGLTRDISDSVRLTRSGAFVGTVNYVSPEQVRGLSPTASADIYSLTAVLFECLTGQLPYVRDNVAAITIGSSGADAVLRKRADSTTARRGGRLRYTITFRNPGPGPLHDVKVCDDLPSAVTYASASPKPFLERGRLCWRTRSLSAGASRTFTIRVRVDRDARGTSTTNRAVATRPRDHDPARRRDSEAGPWRCARHEHWRRGHRLSVSLQRTLLAARQRDWPATTGVRSHHRFKKRSVSSSARRARVCWRSASVSAEICPGLKKLAGDPRVTRVGAFLCPSGIDELPQPGRRSGRARHRRGEGAPPIATPAPDGPARGGEGLGQNLTLGPVDTRIREMPD